MLSALERTQKIHVIRALPRKVEGAVEGLGNRQLDTPYREGGWTIRQVVHHLADSHMNAFVRMKLILTEDHPTLKPYNQDEWAKLVDSNALPIQSSLAILRGLHERWTEVMESMPEKAWGRTGRHPEHGDITLDSMLVTYSNHGEKHVGHIMSLRNAKGW